jgi:hypothetical protein
MNIELLTNISMLIDMYSIAWKFPVVKKICAFYISFITKSMDYNPSWEDNSRSANQEIPLLLWKPNVCYRVNKSSPLISVQSQLNAMHNLTPYIVKTPYYYTIYDHVFKVASSLWVSLRKVYSLGLCISPSLIHILMVRRLIYIYKHLS